jgi:hypothetical protein
MAGAYTSTGTYSNLTRLELEQLRRADFEAGGKALTVGDSALPPEGVVGPGNVQTEPFYSGPTVNLDDVYPITPPQLPGSGLTTKTALGALISETVKWWGPLGVFDSHLSGFATAAGTWQDNTLVTNFVVLGVQPGDILCIKPSSGVGELNANVVGTITVVAPNTLTVSDIWNPGTVTNAFDFGAGDLFSYVIVRPQAMQLFAVPGSGPKGHEQTFLMVGPGAIHNQLNPSLAAINAQRVQNIVRPQESANDRADFVFDNGTLRSVLRSSLDTLGYRVVLYPSNGAGTGPDYTKPITTLNPVIDPAIPATDQRMTIDYRAGTVRFSCAPQLGGNIKVAGGVNVTTGRIQLYAVFWSIDLSLTKGSSRGVYFPRSDDFQSFAAGKIQFNNSGVIANNSVYKGFQIGATALGDDAYVKALGAPDVQVSSPTSYPFLPPWRRASAEFGTTEVTSSLSTRGLRYFSYRQDSQQWRFLAKTSEFFATFGYPDTEMFVADKTAFTVSDAGGPANAAANMNPLSTFGGDARGIRSHLDAGLTTTLHAQLTTTPFGTVHLKKGRYYIQNAIMVPPGTTIEGEGAGTRLIYRNFDSTVGSMVASVSGPIKVGPNTTWGVYDASSWPDPLAWMGTNISPTVTTLAAFEKVEGTDTVWNPVRRVWATVYGSLTTGEILFNEIREDGSKVFPGIGVNIKDNANPLFGRLSTGGQWHSGGHYPRLAYSEHANEYTICWVEEHTVGPNSGGRVAFRQFQLNTDTSQEGWEIIYTDATLYPVTTNNFSDHPSIASENYSATGDYIACLVYWTYNYTGNTPTASQVDRRYIKAGAVFTSTSSTAGIPSTAIVSSTSVEADELGGFMAVWSIQNHPLYLDAGGTITVGATSFLTDPGYPAWATSGVKVGSKVHVLVSPTFPTVQQGLSGVVTSIAGANLFIKWEGASDFLAEAGVTWAVSPSSVIRGRRVRQSAGVITEAGLDVGVVAANQVSLYQMEMREPDYVRISRGASNWCVVFQGFNTHCVPSYPRVKNFDNGVTASGPTWSGSAFPGGDIPSNDISAVYREHVSTCSVVLRDDGQQVYPTQKNYLPAGAGNEWTGVLTSQVDPQFPGRISRDLEVSLKSLGTRTPITERPNHQRGVRIPYNHAREVSFLNFSYRWTMAGVESCIPDVTWTGQDWVAVSPSKNSIHSFTGNYQVNGLNSWFTDPLFYFGSDAAGTANFGWTLRQTIPTGAAIYVPVQPGVPVALTLPIVSVADEHTVNLTGQPLGAAAITGKEWYLLLPEYPLAAGAKNQGFRISSDGQVITSTDFITWADQPSDLSSVPREVELMRRPQAQGGNYPSQVSGTLAGQSADRLQPTSRYKANVGFRGVAPGRPKGIGRRALGESSTVAIAWGESFYGLVDRMAGDESSPSNSVEFFRQTFGPYNVTLRNLAVEATPSSSVEMLSKAHVYTRHLAPTASTLSFDTDGFRNVFVFPTSRIYAPYAPTLVPETSIIGAVYTDAKGNNPVYVDGPTLARGDLSSWPTDPSYENIANNPPRYLAPGVGPKVIWDGQRFVIFWVEKANATTLLVGSSDAAVGYYLCMSYLPGSEDTHMQTGELVDPYEAASSFGGLMAQFPLSAVHISDGTGFSGEGGQAPTPNENNTVSVCEAAFSGKVYAVVWAAGMVPQYDSTAPSMRGSTIGVTLFNMDAAASAGQFPGSGPFPGFGGGGTTYVIDQSTEPGAFQNPKVLWDGSRFTVFYEVVVPTDTASPPTLSSTVFFTTMPEDGGARPQPTRQMSSEGLQTGAGYPTSYPGSNGPFSTTTLGSGGGVHSLGYACQSGTLATGAAPFYSAAYTVIQLFGNQVSPFVASGATGVTNVGSSLFTDGAATFLTRGVRPGDYLVVTSGADQGIYMIDVVTATDINIAASSSTFGTGTAGVNYVVLRYQQANVQPGDQLVVTRVMDTNTLVTSVDSNGVYPVINYDPRRHQLIVQGLFNSGDINVLGGKAIYGEIRGGGMSDYDNAGSLESTKAGVTTRGALIQNPTWANSSSPQTSILHGVTYNEVEDEFAVLVTNGGSQLALYGFKPSVRATTPEVVLNYPPVEVPFQRGDVAWNGSHYLVVMPMLQLGTSKAQLQAKLLNSRFGEVGSAVLHPNT